MMQDILSACIISLMIVSKADSGVLCDAANEIVFFLHEELFAELGKAQNVMHN